MKYTLLSILVCILGLATSSRSAAAEPECAPRNYVPGYDQVLVEIHSLWLVPLPDVNIPLYETINTLKKTAFTPDAVSLSYIDSVIGKTSQSTLPVEPIFRDTGGNPAPSLIGEGWSMSTPPGFPFQGLLADAEESLPSCSYGSQLLNNPIGGRVYITDMIASFMSWVAAHPEQAKDSAQDNAKKRQEAHHAAELEPDNDVFTIRIYQITPGQRSAYERKRDGKFSVISEDEAGRFPTRVFRKGVETDVEFRYARKSKSLTGRQVFRGSVFINEVFARWHIAQAKLTRTGVAGVGSGYPELNDDITQPFYLRQLTLSDLLKERQLIQGTDDKGKIVLGVLRNPVTGRIEKIIKDPSDLEELSALCDKNTCVRFIDSEAGANSAIPAEDFTADELRPLYASWISGAKGASTSDSKGQRDDAGTAQEMPEKLKPLMSRTNLIFSDGPAMRQIRGLGPSFLGILYFRIGYPPAVATSLEGMKTVEDVFRSGKDWSLRRAFLPDGKRANGFYVLVIPNSDGKTVRNSRRLLPRDAMALVNRAGWIVGVLREVGKDQATNAQRLSRDPALKQREAELKAKLAANERIAAKMQKAIRLAGLHRLNQEDLVKLAVEDKDEEIRAAALALVTDRPALAEASYRKAIRENTVASYLAVLTAFPDHVAAPDMLLRLKALNQNDKNKRLGELAVQMAPQWITAMSFDPFSTDAKTAYERKPSPVMKNSLDEFGILLSVGANPDEIRIKGYSEGFTGGAAVEPGSSGTPVLAADGGLTLLEYFKANKLQDAVQLLEKHNAKRKFDRNPEKPQKKR